MTPNEEWRPVVGGEEYHEVSNLGRVRSISRTVYLVDGRKRPLAGRVLHPATKPTGHKVVNLRRGNGPKTFLVHALVMAAFVGPRPEGLDICHNNGDPSDNRLENLRYDTRLANILDSVRHGTHGNTKKTHCKRGHEFTPENTATSPKRSGRECLACRKINYQEQRARLGKWPLERPA